ncbi:hypothetical protein [Rhodohalobacter sulfatireducens]|nr:hypothetical protein [Rhodohalobacter sulfatireducens]
MSKADIENLTDEEVLELGEPILKATEGTIKLSDTTLQKLKTPAEEMADQLRSISKKQYNELSDRLQQVIRRYEGDQPKLRNLDASDIKSILLDYADAESGTMQMSATCRSMFNTMGSFVFLYPGDNLNTANSICSAGSTFYVHQGTYYSQKIEDSKDGNEWVGINDPILDGQFSVNKAFKGGMKNNTINGLTLKKYTEYGIHSASSNTTNVYIVYMTFEKIGAGKNGEYFSAIRFDNGEDLSVRHSYFEDVSSGILFTDTDGPLEVLNNEALNSGRNFLQCSDCNGGGIRINGNSMDRTSSTYGSEELEDWISIFESEGLQNDWIQVKNNRARGHSSSMWGSFLILGDSGGKYQEASENIGVSPGQVGIGAAGGQYMKIENNQMFSVQWASSNVAFYSADYSSPAPCSNHEFPASPNPNVAHWKNSSGTLNRSSSDGNCGISNAQIRSNVDEDTSMDEDIWNDW